MARVTTTSIVDGPTLDGLRQGRRDLLIERPAGPDRWDMADGPFTTYERSLAVTPLDSGPDGGDRYEVEERTEFKLAVPIWSPLLTPLMRRALASHDRNPRRRWWWPSQIVPARTATLVGTLCGLSVLTGYLGVLIGQTIAFAAKDFGQDDAAEANTLAAVRIGVLISLILVHRADRVGRRPLILGFATAAIAFTVIGAAAPNLIVLGSAQAIARGLTTGLITLVVLAATEEVPSGVRAFTISLITITAALGAGMVVWVLPLNDVIDQGWRIAYLVPLLLSPVLLVAARHLPETRRFDAAVDHDAPAPISWYRFGLIGFGAFSSALFLSPASQLRNEFLIDDLSFSASAVSLFQLVISAPAGTAILLSGLAADRFGRRWIAAGGLSIGVTMMALSYQLTGAWLWVAASAGVVLTGAAFPASRGYQTELFPTRARARVGGMLDVIGVAGSAVGLVVVGYLSTRWDDLGSAIGVMVVAPLVVAVVIIVFFPETASTELEAFNPGDPDLSPTGPSSSTAGTDDREPPGGPAEADEAGPEPPPSEGRLRT